MDDATLKAALAGERLALLERLGEGGYGIVYKARLDPIEDEAARGARLVALKVLKDARHRPGDLASLRLRHRNIVAALGAGEVLGKPYLVLELFEGKSLRELLARGPLEPALLRPVLLALLDAVEYAHARGVVHCDLKPENVLVREEGGTVTVKLTDFGLAASLASDARELAASRTLRSGEAAAGTLAYMAPERIDSRDARPDARADVFALGVIVFELLTGRAPLGLELPSELAPRVDARFDRVVKRAMARDPARRFPSVREMRVELLPLLPRSPSGRVAPAAATTAWDPFEMVAIPGGRFTRGFAGEPDAPPRDVDLSPFLIDRYPVTNEAYLAYVVATGAKPPRSWPRGGSLRALPDALAPLPVTGVTWDDARAFAAWAGKRLPTEAEWERAARGPSGRRFPYGDAFDRARIHADAVGPVDAHADGRSEESVFDLTGNAWEWCADWFAPDAYATATAKDPRGPERGSARVIRGGFDPAREGSGSSVHRAFLRPDVAHPRVGFRCAKDAR